MNQSYRTMFFNECNKIEPDSTSTMPLWSFLCPYINIPYKILKGKKSKFEKWIIKNRNNFYPHQEVEIRRERIRLFKSEKTIKYPASSSSVNRKNKACPCCGSDVTCDVEISYDILRASKEIFDNYLQNNNIPPEKLEIIIEIRKNLVSRYNLN